MDKAEILRHVDHTQLKAFAVWNDIKKLCDEAIHYKTASVCIPPSYIKMIQGHYGDGAPVICTVVGFPLGYSVTEAKLMEVEIALRDGVDEVDMVVNIAYVKNHFYDKVLDEVRRLKSALGDKILKVIIETCYLDTDEKIKLCEIVTEAKADFIKTSTGFGSAGATLADVDLFKKHIGTQVKIKAAGGIKSAADLEMFIKAGCERLGTSSAVSLLMGGSAGSY